MTVLPKRQTPMCFLNCTGNKHFDNNSFQPHMLSTQENPHFQALARKALNGNAKTVPKPSLDSIHRYPLKTKSQPHKENRQKENHINRPLRASHNSN
jgi:hypothetical protein